MPRAAGAERQKALADKKAAKEAEAAAKAEAEAQKKAEAQAKKAAKEAEEDADDEEDDGEDDQAPVTPKGKGKGKGKKALPEGKTPKGNKKAAAPKAKAAGPRKGKAAAPKKGKAAADDEEDGEDEEDGGNDEQPPVTPKGKGKGKKASPKGKGKAAAPEKAAPEKAAPEKAAPEKAAPEKAAPEKAAPEKAAPEKAAPEKAAPKKAAAKKKTAATKKNAAHQTAIPVTNERAAAKSVAGIKRAVSEMEDDENEEGEAEDGEDEENEEDYPQPPAKKVKPNAITKTGAKPNAIAKTAVNPNPRKRLAGQDTFLIPRKSVPLARGPRRLTTSSEVARAEEAAAGAGGADRNRSSQAAYDEAGRFAREWLEKQKQKKGQVKNKRWRLPPVRVAVRNGTGRVQEREVEFDDDDDDDERRPGQGRSRGRGEDEEREVDEYWGPEGVEDREIFNRYRDGIRSQKMAGAAAAAAPPPPPPPPPPAAPAAAAEGGEGDPDGDPSDPSDLSDPSDPSDPSESSGSSSPSITSERLYRHLPDIQEPQERLRSRLAQLRESYQTRLQRTAADGLEYTQGIFTRALGRDYGDPVTAEDLGRDFAHLKFLVQKLVGKIPVDRMDELEVMVPSIRAEFRTLTRHVNAYWRPDRETLGRWLLEALVWRRLHKLMFDRTRSEYFAFGHGKEMLMEFWVTSLTACVEDDFPESVSYLCELRARLATFLKEMYEEESPSRVARAFEEVFCHGILDFLREKDRNDDQRTGRYFHEERAEREREMQELAVQIIGHASDLNSRMLRSSGNWALIYTDPRYEEDTYGYPFLPDKMHLRDLEDNYVARENPPGGLEALQQDEMGKEVLLAITPGLWDFTEWAHIDPHYAVPHVRTEVSTLKHIRAMAKTAKKAKPKDKRGLRRATMFNRSNS